MKNLYLLKPALLFLCICVCTTFSVYAANGTFGGGDGSPGSPYIIEDAADLDAVRNGLSLHYKLGNDIDLTEYLASGGAGYAKWGAEGWMPIGNNYTTFNGTFNGDGYKISGVWFIRNSTGNIYQGLFGFANGNSGRIENLGVEIAPAGMNGLRRVGGLVGQIGDAFTITNCYTTGYVTGESEIGGLVGQAGNTNTISNCYTTGNVHGAGTTSYAGGLVGDNASTISNCYTTGDITGNGSLIGGLTGINYGPISNCYATGNVMGTNDIGGLVGRGVSSGAIRNCVAANLSITATATSGTIYISRIAANNYNTLTNNYALETMLVNNALITTGTLGNADGFSMPLTALMTLTFYNTPSNWNTAPWDIGTAATIWSICEDETLPLLTWQDICVNRCGTGTGTVSDPYIICTAADLDNVRNNLAAHYKLGKDIDLMEYLAEGGDGYDKWGTAGWMPIGRNFSGYQFIGSLDGDGKVVKNLASNTALSGDAGLFGYIIGGTIKNLGIEDCNININNVSSVGGLAGSVSNCLISNCYVTGTIKGRTVGGLVGRTTSNLTNIQNCYTTCDVSGFDDSDNVGGIVGSNTGTIENCYATGNISGYNNVGGIVGYNNATRIIRNCVAANTSVTATNGTLANRIVGNATGSLQNNYANEDMVVKRNNAEVTVTGTLTDANGASMSLESLKTLNFYETGNNWYNTAPWSISEDPDPEKIWRICWNGSLFPLFQWQTFDACPLVTAQAPLITLQPQSATLPLGDTGTTHPLSVTANVTDGGTLSYQWYSTTDPYEEGTEIEGAIFKNFNAPKDLKGTFYYFVVITNTITDNGDGGAKTATTTSAIATIKVSQLFCGGIGTATNPYLICNPEQLDSVRYFLSSHFKMMEDVDLSGYLANGGAGYAKWGAEGWLPIGTSATGNQFTGSFDGNGYKISELWINRTSSFNIGLFGYTNGSMIKNLGVEISTAGIRGYGYAGGLVGYNNNSPITNCYTTGNVNISNNVGGGLVGQNTNSNITNCYATGNVNGGAYTSVGGLVGSDNNSIITNCYTTGNVSTFGYSGTYYSSVGGLVGEGSWSNIINCYATGNVTGDATGSYSANVGGLVGLLVHGSIRDCVAANSVVFTYGGTLNTNRIIGFGYGSRSNNYAFEDMLVNETTVTTGTHDNFNGASASLESLKAFDFYATGSNWYQNTPWDIERSRNTPPVWSICDHATLPFLSWEERDEVCPFVITATKGENGEITPSGYVLVMPGETQEFTIMPDNCFEVESILVDELNLFDNTSPDGVTISPAGGGRGWTLAFEEVQQNWEVHVTFKEFVYTTPREESICAGDSLFFYDRFIKEAGTYAHKLYSVLGCDSIINLTLTVVANVPAEFEDIVTEYCAGATIPALPLISDNGFSGTWTPTINNTTTTTYTFTPNKGECANTAQVTITIIPNITPEFDFDLELEYCQNATNTVELPSYSTNGISGIWSPATIGTSVPGTVNYTFTPASTECVIGDGKVTVTVTVIENVTPAFAFGTTLDYCMDATSVTLPTTSTNGVTGTWNPAAIVTTESGTETYTFTPAAGSCVIGTGVVALTVNVSDNPTPSFNFLLTQTYCQNAMPIELPTVSTNNVAGTWNPAAIVTTTPGTSSYIFTPGDGECAEQTIELSVTVIQNVTPEFEFDLIQTYCQNATPISLPLAEANGNEGVWEPAVIVTSTPTESEPDIYTFTVNPDACVIGDGIVELSVTVIENITPTFNFASTLEYCQNAMPVSLPNVSTNGVNGTWSPAAILTTTPGTATYTFTPASEECVIGTGVVTVSVTVIENITPTFDFDLELEYCQNATNTVELPSYSTNGISGIWSPAAIGTSVPGTVNYTFTPASTECVIGDGKVTVTVTVIENVTPTFGFGATLDYCMDATPVSLPATSTNGITGSWSPAAIVTTESGTETYTFTPAAGSCVIGNGVVVLTVNVSDNPTPSFNFLLTQTYCQNAMPIELPTVSTNNVAGTWNPAAIVTTTPGTSSYIFTPGDGECAEQTIEVLVTVIQNLTPEFEFDLIQTYCQNATPIFLPLAEANGNEGVWEPAVIVTSTPTESEPDIYTFTVNSGACVIGDGVVTVSVTVIEKLTPTFNFASTLEYCQYETPVTLPNVSQNGISGTWSPTAIVTSTPTGSTPNVYTFTPAADECAYTTQISVTVITKQTPVFSGIITEYCAGSAIPALPVSSGNGISGSWSPAINNLATTTYTFTPSAGICAFTTQITITINQKVTPVFVGVGTLYIIGDTPDDLPLTSDNGISGTWNPTVIETSVAGTETYIFTPNADECANTAQITIIVKPPHFVITATAGANGTINPSGYNEIEPGEDQTFTFLPTAGFEVDKVYVDGVSINPVPASSYTFVNVSDDHAIVVIFKSTGSLLCPDQVYDVANNIIYNVVELEGLCWTKENMRGTLYQSGGVIPFAKPYTYHGVHADPEIFGLLYSWYSATGVLEEHSFEITCEMQGICPNGWRLPTQGEWNSLRAYSAQQLKSTQYWLEPPGGGTNETGFSAIPAGLYNGNLNRFEDMYGFAGWWASNTPAGANAYYFYLTYYCDDLRSDLKRKIDGLSVRCVME